MSELLDRALGAVLALPDDDQDVIARAMLALAGQGESVEPIDPAHLPAVMEGLQQARRGQFATKEALEAAYARFGE
jgi:hypothetical protein